MCGTYTALVCTGKELKQYQHMCFHTSYTSSGLVTTNKQCLIELNHLKSDIYCMFHNELIDDKFRRQTPLYQRSRSTARGEVSRSAAKDAVYWC